MTDPIESRVVALETAFKGFKCLMEERERTLSKALDLQAAEYSRRLDALNHENVERRELLRTFVSQAAHDEQLRRMTDKLDSLTASRDKLAGRDTAITISLSVAIPLIILALNYLLRGT